MNYFLTKTKFEENAENGELVTTKMQHLIDALSFTETEARIIEELQPHVSGSFKITGIVPTKIDEIFFNEQGDKWFKAKVAFIVFDEEKGKEKKIASIMYIQASDMTEARELLKTNMKGSMSDWREESITETKIDEVLTIKK